MMDLISRQAAIDALKRDEEYDEDIPNRADGVRDAIITIMGLPSVQTHSEGLYIDGRNDGYMEGWKKDERHRERKYGKMGETDLISRQAAIEIASDKRCGMNFFDPSEKAMYEVLSDVIHDLFSLPSAQPIECRKQGEWDMFELITTAWYGKQYYFKEENGMAYSRESHKTMTVHDAILEFIREIGDE